MNIEPIITYSCIKLLILIGNLLKCETAIENSENNSQENKLNDLNGLKRYNIQENGPIKSKLNNYYLKFVINFC